MRRYIGLLAIILVSAAFTSCQSTATPDGQPAFASYKSPYPKGSGVAISPVLEEDAIRNLKQYLKQQYGTDTFEILARESIGPARDFAIDGKGRLVAGQLHEIWTIKHSEKVVKLEFIMFPDGRRGNTVGFKEYRN